MTQVSGSGRTGQSAHRQHTLFIPRDWKAVSAIILLALLGAGCATQPPVNAELAADDPRAGILTTTEGERLYLLPSTFSYTGEGTFVQPDGETLTGVFLDGLLQGPGQLTNNDATYTGDFKNGLFEGQGKLELTDGGVYEGQFQGGKFAGSGRFTSPSGYVYVGSWLEGLKSGFGQNSHPSGYAYTGEWMADQPHGFGTEQTRLGDQYDGQWHAGEKHGYGVLRNRRSVEYEGVWLNNLRHGFGEERSPDGSAYRGEWQADQRHGQGTISRLDGSAHTGTWRSNGIAGHGVRTTASGLTLTGLWDGDLLTEGKLQLTDGATFSGPLFSLNEAQKRSISPELINWMSEKAETGNTDAMYFMASAYADFVHPTPDPQASEYWLARAANDGHVHGAFQYGLRQMPDNADMGLIYLQQAAESGHRDANLRLGEFRHTGQFLEKDLQQAIVHYEIARKKGSLVATNNLAWLLATSDAVPASEAQRAIDMVTPVVQFSGDWQHLDTLAAAHARNGAFRRAVRLQKEVLRLAELPADDNILQQMQERLALYEANKPYLE